MLQTLKLIRKKCKMSKIKVGKGLAPIGVNFINVLRADFTLAYPKSAKKSDNLTVFFALWDLRAQKLLIEC